MRKENNMEERRLFVNDKDDKSLEDCIDKLRKLSKQRKETVYLRWNRFTIPIRAADTIENIMDDYNSQCRAHNLLIADIKGEIMTVADLSKKIAGLFKNLMKG